MCGRLQAPSLSTQNNRNNRKKKDNNKSKTGSQLRQYSNDAKSEQTVLREKNETGRTTFPDVNTEEGRKENYQIDFDCTLKYTFILFQQKETSPNDILQFTKMKSFLKLRSDSFISTFQTAAVIHVHYQ